MVTEWNQAPAVFSAKQTVPAPKKGAEGGHDIRSIFSSVFLQGNVGWWDQSNNELLLYFILIFDSYKDDVDVMYLNTRKILE